MAMIKAREFHQDNRRKLWSSWSQSNKPQNLGNLVSQLYSDLNDPRDYVVNGMVFPSIRELIKDSEQEKKESE
jgi:hypothetical protein